MEPSSYAFWEKSIEPLKPILKWAGGKTKLLPELVANLPTFANYHEPFLGGGALWLYLKPTRAYISDSNVEVINLYKAIRDNPYALMSDLDLFMKNHSKAQFLEVRTRDRQPGYTADASRFVYLNKSCFNGLTRYNSKGYFNTPIGDGIGPFYVSKDIMALHEYLASSAIQFTSGDFSEALKNIRERDLLYLDPPYAPLSATSNFVGYSKDGFSHNDQIRVQELAFQAHTLGAWVMISNNDTPLVRGLYSSERWHIRTVQCARSINSKANSRGKISELIISNF